MVKRTYNFDDSEPEGKKFDLPSPKEHLFQVTNIYMKGDNPFKNGLPDDIVTVKCEVVGGDEEGRTLLQRLSLDESAKGFFATRIFLKAIGEPHKGQVEIDTDRFVGRQFYATVVHNGQYANIDQYNFDKPVEQYKPPINPGGALKPEDIVWSD